MNLKCVPRLAKAVRIRKESFGYLVFDPSTMNVYELNEYGKQVLDVCDGKSALEDIAARLGCSSDDIVDLDVFLQDLLQRQIIEVT